MMQKDKATPEEKLLHLIENPDQQTAKKQFKPPFKRKPQLNLSHLSRVVREFWLKRRVKVLTLRFANKVLIVLALLVSVFLVFDFISGSKNIANLYLMEKTLIPSEFKVDKIAEALPLSDYLDEVEKRNVFTSPQEAIPAYSYEEEEEITLTSLAEGLVLVGILWSDNPQAMIEDTASNKTYILNKGDLINDLLIKDILRDKVILSYQGEEMEML